LTSKLSVNGRAAYTHSDFNDFARVDKIVDAGAGLRYYVMPNVYLGADLRIIDRASSDIAAQYSRNQMLVSVGYTPARNRDYSIIPEREAGAPEAPRAQGVYSGFYLGAQLGHGGLTTATWGPRGGGGSDTAGMGALVPATRCSAAGAPSSPTTGISASNSTAATATPTGNTARSRMTPPPYSSTRTATMA